MGNSDPFFIAVVVVAALILIGFIGYFVYSLAQATVTRKARVIGKRKTTGSSTAQCTFEFEDGSREEHTVSVDTYFALAVNDVGYVKTRGAVFWGFVPERAGTPVPAGSFMSASIPEETLARIKVALFGGRKLEAIRLYRECTGSELIQAKAAVDRLEAELRATEPESFG